MFFLKKNTYKQNNLSNYSQTMLDYRLYEFKNKIKKISKEEASAYLLAKQLSKLIKADKF